MNNAKTRKLLIKAIKSLEIDEVAVLVSRVEYPVDSRKQKREAKT